MLQKWGCCHKRGGKIVLSFMNLHFRLTVISQARLRNRQAAASYSRSSTPPRSRVLRLAKLHKSTGIGTLALLIFYASFLSTQKIGAEIKDGDDSKTIAELLTREEAAWDRGDAKGFAEHFDIDGSFTTVAGMVLFGREEFEKRHAEILKTVFKGSTLKLIIRRIHFPNPDVAVVDTDNEVTNYQQLPLGVAVPRDGVLKTCLLQVLVRKNGIWWIVAYHNVAVASQPTRP
jgi:uncharacterized protein (TIGR02246 family)